MPEVDEPMEMAVRREPREERVRGLSPRDVLEEKAERLEREASRMDDQVLYLATELESCRASAALSRAAAQDLRLAAKRLT